MANVWQDPSQFVPFVNPNGETFQIPNQFAGAFNLPPPPDVSVPSPGAPPTFDPAELPPPPPPATPQMPAVQAPPTPTLPLPAPPPAPSAQPAAAPVAPPPKQEAPPAGPPQTALEMGMGAIEQRKDIATRQGDANARAAAAEQDIYAKSDEREAALEADRKAAREAEAKELAKYRAGVKDATDRYVNFKVDENRAWNNLGTSRKLLAGIGVLLSGLGNALAKKGSASNGALDFIMQTLKEDAASQRDERGQLRDAIGQKKDALADLRAQFGDNEAAFQAELGANAKRVANQIRTMGAAAKTDTAKLNAEAAAAELDAAGAQLLDAAEQRDYQRRIDERNFKLAKSSNALGWANHKRGVFESDRAFDEGKRRFDAELGIREQEAVAKAQEARAKGDEAEAKRLEKEAEKAKKEADEIRNLSIGAGTRKVVTGPDGQPVVQYEPLKQRDGSIYKAPDKLSEALQKKKGSVDNLVKLMDDTVNLMDRHGHEPDFAKSAAWQEMQNNWANMAIDEKTISELGVLAGPDMGLIAKKLGTGDPTGLISEIPGIRKGRRNAIDKLDSELRAAGYNGPKYDIPEITDKGVLERTKNTSVGDLVEKAQATERGMRADMRHHSNVIAGKASPYDRAPAIPTEGAENAVGILVNTALNGPEDRKQMARDALQMMMNHKNAGIRELVRKYNADLPGLGLSIPVTK